MRETKLIKEYIEDQKDREVSDNSIKSEMNTIRLLSEFVPPTYQSVKAIDIIKAREIVRELEKRMAGSSMRTFKGNIASLYNFMAISNPFSKIQLKVKKRDGDESVKILQPEELGMIFSKFNKLHITDQVVTQLYFNTGIRNKELVDCNREDYDSKNRVLKLNNTKTSNVEYIELSKKTCMLLDKYLSSRRDCDNALVVTDKFNKRMGVKTTLKTVKNFTSSSDKNVTLQMIRRTVASILLANGVSENDTEDRLRHKKIGSVGRTNYQKKVNEKMYQLAEKMDEILENEVIKYEKSL